MNYSYDIFDTVIYRCVPHSIDIFKMMEDDPRIKILWQDDLPRFSKIRIKCEFWVRRKKKKEINIEDIYKEINKKVKLDSSAIQKLMELEYSVEKEQSFLNYRTINSIKKHLKNGEKVILISDMYWHESQLRDWLSSKDPVFDMIPIYVSCDYGVKKKDGELFSLVAERENIKFQDWIHIGDNKIADGNAPRKLGIHSKVIPDDKRYNFENKLKAENIDTLKTYGLITRARNDSTGNPFDLGASIAGPMVYQYVGWLLYTALNKQIKKLYFVMRDGYILKLVADKIIAYRNLDIKTAFIFGSRVAWRFPEISIENLHHLSMWEKSNWIFRDPAEAYVPFERLGFNHDTLNRIFGKRFGQNKLYSFREFKMVLEYALNNPTFCSILEENIQQAKTNLYAYLKQTIDFNESFALVDTNSTGKTQDDLTRFFITMERKNGKECKSEVFKFFYHTFLSDNEPNKQSQFVFINADKDDKRFPEAFFRAPYNPCYGYKKTPQGIIPIFQKSDKCAWTYSFDYDEYLQGILAFTKIKEEQGRNIDINHYVDILFKVVNFEIISKDEISQAAKLPFNPNLKGEEILDFYPEIRIKALFHPFSELIYYPKGSYYNGGKFWIILYKFLYKMVNLKRNLRK